MRTSRVKIIVAVGAAILIALWSGVSFRGGLSGGKTLRVYFFDVGQGDAALIVTPEGKDILVDGGPGNALSSELGAVLPFYDRTIELMIITHNHSDHLEGFIDVLRRYKVDRLLWNGSPHDSNVYKTMMQEAQAHKVPQSIASAEHFEIEPGVSMDILWPPRRVAGADANRVQATGTPSKAGTWFDNPDERPSVRDVTEKDDQNSRSIVFILHYGESDFLFTGDAEVDVEQELLKEGKYTPVEVLKVSHHGSKTGSSKEMLAAARPQYAVIMVGRKNKYGHPHSVTLRRLESAGAQVLRTDQEGTIEVTTDGKSLQITTKNDQALLKKLYTALF
ncbi:MAG: putative hydrolase (metallo-beta-lactamase superfamily) [Candidatus Magasanikbacteria bacterium]|nr:putative hydrolase (metallo-beta-lactamase superfamily) [Candidatus Magasanikbacteria bacterium]